jgi:hypothetical protein
MPPKRLILKNLARSSAPADGHGMLKVAFYLQKIRQRHHTLLIRANEVERIILDRFGVPFS